jgi:hypothetical protein
LKAPAPAPTPPPPVNNTPQQFLDQVLRSRGYSTQSYATLRTAYYNVPTKLQRASYDVHILKVIIRDKDPEALEDLLSCGLSPNACNKYGESLIHKVCKAGNDKLLQVFLDCGADVQVSDGAGRTPLHNACWGGRASRPSFQVFEMILQQDLSMIYMRDHTGALPLQYVRKEQYEVWIQFLKSMLKVHWKPLDAQQQAQQQEQRSELTFLPANCRPIQDPENALPIKLAKLVASGRMEPDQAMIANDSFLEDWDDTSSVGSFVSQCSTSASEGWDEVAWEPDQTTSTALGSDTGNDATDNDGTDRDQDDEETDEFNALQDFVEILNQKKRQVAVLTKAAANTKKQ